MSSDVQLFIDGRWSDSASGETIDIVNPATDQVVGAVSAAKAQDLERAVAAANRGFKVWRSTSAVERCQLMRKAADLLRQRVEMIATRLTIEQGKPLREARLEVMVSADIIDWLAEEGRRIYGRLVPSRAKDVRQTVVREPLGPVAAFTPWNFPLSQTVRKIAAALAAGCSIVVKGPEETPGSPAELVRAFADAGIPDGVVNLVYGTPAEISAFLIPHPAIRKISFTGSVPVGKQLAALAGKYMKPTTMELGGHAPAIVCGDADIELASSLLCAAKFRNAGQVCVSPTRFLVQRKVLDRFADSFMKATKAINVGDGLEEATEMGPVVSHRRLQAIDGLVRDAVQHGAELAIGGHRIGNAGSFFAPTVLMSVGRQAVAMNEEPFGPLALIRGFDELDEAIAEANRLPYGLAAYAFTNSELTADRLTVELETGMLTVNHLGLALPELPFGGIKDSGYGSEGGTEAVDAFLHPKLVTHRVLC